MAAHDCLNEWVIYRFVQTSDSFRNEASDFCLHERVRESLTHLICLKTWIHSVTKHRCVARRHKTVLSEIEQKQSILCLKCKSLNLNFLFIELLFYKITLQSHWNILLVQCCIPKSYIIIFFFLLPQYVCAVALICFDFGTSLSHTHTHTGMT